MKAIQDFYNQELKIKKTIASKKSFLTRSEKQVKEHLEDMQEILLRYKNDSSKAYYLGEKITKIRLAKVKTELKIIQDLYQSLANGLKAPLTKGLRTFAAKTVGVNGLKKENGRLKKGYKYVKGGKIVKINK